MLEKKEIIDLVQVQEDGVLNVRTAIIVSEDGVEIGRTYRRRPVKPGYDLTREPKRVFDIGVVVHTPKVVADFQVAQHSAAVARLEAQDTANPKIADMLVTARLRLADAETALAAAEGG